MIGFLKGRIHSKSDDGLVMDVGGVGYELSVSRRTLDELGLAGDECALEVYTHVAEGVFQLLGFSSRHEKDVFKKLISVSGIGPRMALGILSGLTVPELIRALLAEDLATLTAISGVGKKTAERLVLELRDKFKDEAERMAVGAGAVARAGGFAELRDPVQRDALAALVSLGYADPLARRALSQLEKVPNENVQSLIKKSLGVLSR